MPKQKTSGSATLNDVAKLAGVSLATASRVLSNSEYPVREELKIKILNASKELNYTPNLLAKMLKSNSYHAIGVIVPTLQNPFYNQVILGIESAARKRNFEIMMLSSHRNIEQERNNIKLMLQNRVMALIIISIDSNNTTLNNYIACGGKVALLEANYSLKHAISTETDNISAGRIATEYLVESGHRSIAFLSSPLIKNSRRSLLIGISETLKEYGIDFSNEDHFIASSEVEIDTGLYEFEVGKQLTESLINAQKNYTAIIAANDLLAYGILQALSQNHISVPSDISVISFDNITYSEMTSPALTTVEMPSSEMGFTACNMLIDNMTSPNSKLTDVVFKFQGRLIERQSVKLIR